MVCPVGLAKARRHATNFLEKGVLPDHWRSECIPTGRSFSSRRRGPGANWVRFFRDHPARLGSFFPSGVEPTGFVFPISSRGRLRPGFFESRGRTAGRASPIRRLGEIEFPGEISRSFPEESDQECRRPRSESALTPGRPGSILSPAWIAKATAARRCPLMPHHEFSPVSSPRPPHGRSGTFAQVDHARRSCRGVDRSWPRRAFR